MIVPVFGLANYLKRLSHPVPDGTKYLCALHNDNNLRIQTEKKSD